MRILLAYVVYVNVTVSDSLFMALYIIKNHSRDV